MNPTATGQGPEWIEWRGGTCPVAPGVRVQVRYRTGWAPACHPDGQGDGTTMRWSHDNRPGDIVAYRVIGEPVLEEREPTGIEALVCADIARRQGLGIAKYGQTVAENPLPFDAWLKHSYEECLDMAVYLRRAIEELRANLAGAPAAAAPADHCGDANKMVSAGEPVATLHDDGCFTWTRDEFRLKYDSPFAGWRMDVYATPPAAARVPLTRELVREVKADVQEVFQAFGAETEQVVRDVIEYTAEVLNSKIEAAGQEGGAA